MERKERKEEEKQPSFKVETVVSMKVADSTNERTKAFNKECNDFRNKLGMKKKAIQESLNQKLAENPSYHGHRGKGVKLASEYEQAEISMGGKGTANWNNEQRNELINTGKIRGANGHHINSVATNPELQADPDNIRFYSSRDEHIKKGHNGDVNNPSSGPLLDRDQRLIDANNKRVMQNELKGVGKALCVGFVNGMYHSIHGACKKYGMTWNAVKEGTKQCGKPVVMSCAVSFTAYMITRGLDYLFK